MGMPKISKIGISNSGAEQWEGYYALAPNGCVVLLPEGHPLKDGWQYATQNEIDGKKPAPVPEPIPEPHWDDEPAHSE